jgi:Tartrate dehydratase alpha subunit/Fumarate hydratase class I, N-terminal domain
MTTSIRQNDLIESIAAALQYISYYHPADYIAHLARAYEREQSAAAKDAIAQILTNSKMSATGHRPICQDTGIVNVFLKVGMDVRWDGFTGSLDDAITKACAVATTILTIRCAPAWWPTRSSSARIPRTTPRP